MGKFIQYELWKDCHNQCQFCYNKGEPKTNKIERLNYIIGKLTDEESLMFDEIGFIGGDFFHNQIDDEEVKSLFYKLFNICYERRKNKTLNKLCICTSLMFDINRHLINFLTYLKDINLLDITLLCTSYDTIYRFQNEKQLQIWENNMLELHQLFPELKIHTETLLTQDFINKVINDEFNIKEFCEKFNTTIDYIEPSTGFYYNTKYEMDKVLPNFFPTKKSFVRFIKKTIFEEKSVNLQNLLNPYLRANVLYYTANNEYMVIRGRQRNPDCRILKKVENAQLDYGNEVRTVPQFYKDFDRGFIDSDLSMLDVVKQVSELYGDGDV